MVGRKSGVDGESGKTIRRCKANFFGNRVKVPAVGCLVTVERVLTRVLQQGNPAMYWKGKCTFNADSIHSAQAHGRRGEAKP